MNYSSSTDTIAKEEQDVFKICSIAKTVILSEEICVGCKTSKEVKNNDDISLKPNQETVEWKAHFLTGQQNITRSQQSG